MSGVQGADPEGLDELARSLEDAAERLHQILTTTRSLSDRVVWAGADAEAFRRHLDDDLGASIVRSSDTVRRAAEDVRRNAIQQREVSGSGATGGVPGGSFTAVTVPSFLAGAAAAAGSWVGGDPSSAIGDVILGGSVPPPDWDRSPRVAALIQLVEGVPGAGPGDVAWGGAEATGLSPELTGSEAVPDASTASSWADQLFGGR